MLRKARKILNNQFKKNHKLKKIQTSPQKKKQKQVKKSKRRAVTAVIDLR